jgi:hypothetical protein
MPTTDRERRIGDFQRRVAYDPNGVYHHRSHGWSYIPLHHFADESDAPHVDCWCLLDGGAALLECIRASDRPSLEPGLYIRVDSERPCWPKLHAILIEPLTRAVVEAAMQKFVELGFPEKLAVKLQPGAALVRLGARSHEP